MKGLIEMGCLGLIEVKGLTAGFLVSDCMLKASQVSLIDMKKDMGGGLITIVVSGDVSAVTASLAAGNDLGQRISEVIASKILPSPHEEIMPYVNNSHQNQGLVYQKESYGIIEVFGFVCSIVAADVGLKAASVHLSGMERTKSEEGIGLIVAIKFTGSVDAVRCAVEAGARAAKQLGTVLSLRVNAMPDRFIWPMIQYTNLKSD